MAFPNSLPYLWEEKWKCGGYNYTKFLKCLNVQMFLHFIFEILVYCVEFDLCLLIAAYVVIRPEWPLVRWMDGWIDRWIHR